MSRDALLQEIESNQIREDIPPFSVGDTIKVHIRIIEGEKERIQAFSGVVIARKGCGLSETFSVYRVAYGSGMERVFCLHSPRIAKIEVMRLGKVRRAKLYDLRGKAGKAIKVKERLRKKVDKQGSAKELQSAMPVDQESSRVDDSETPAVEHD